MSPSSMNGKVAVVTGASKGIGRAIAERLAADGCDCFLIARSADALAEVAEAIEATGRRAGWAAVDLGALDGVEEAAAAARERFGRVDILVNCAGDTKAGAFPAQPDADWMAGFALKFHGAVRLTRALWPLLVESHGTVINIGGAAAYSPAPGFMIGGAVNAALAHFTKALSKQGLMDDVNVNIVHPGMTASDRMRRLLEQQAEAQGISVEEATAKSEAASGIRRIGTPEDVATTVAFLCDPAARHIQGVQIAVDGGATDGLH
ncbi:SDR family NAD(P)-dependent oxidoreductase [Marivibrio halodurans]|uniref:SDR family NAD(P)-dependent oxidoreductase n=1 Tax=Marivibrio halodurans TaxID=2039722 RepID=A0A8J7S843_9PROT|nr:SDR family NAD(P)-dependent oxidoreductase [Marivibrio halodurans]MBP5858594.1 SDR family NAD(P)-dependent oxidoreductase [Marivibrio halodurans]